MVDAVVSPSGPKQWAIYEKPGDKDLGRIIQACDTFTIMAFPGSFLTNVALGPYASKQAAMDAIAAMIGGNCSIGV